MRQSLNEIDEIFTNHNYDVNNIITKNFKKFKLKSAFTKYGFIKTYGFSIIEIMQVLLFLPLLGIKTINKIYTSHYTKQLSEMKKDVYYRFLNNPQTDWRRILLHTAKVFDALTGVRGTTAENSALILDDTTHFKTGKCIEKVSYVFDHVLRKSMLGFKNLTCSHFDGTSYKVVDFSLHSEKELTKKYRAKQYKSSIEKKYAAKTRLKESDRSKIDVGLEMIKRASKNGIRFSYVLVDSWFSSYDFIKTVRNIKCGKVHVVCAMKKDKRYYNYKGNLINAKDLLKKLQGESKAKRNRQNRISYYEVIVEYGEIGKVKLFFGKGSHQRNWKLFLSTDVSFNFNKFAEVYSIRWGIEVIFKECKGYLKIGKCQSESFVAQIADISICYILYNMLIYSKRIGDYKTTGGLFEYLQEDLKEKSVAEKIWELVKDLLEIILEEVSFENITISNWEQLKNSPKFKYVLGLFENSFLTSILKESQ